MSQQARAMAAQIPDDVKVPQTRMLTWVGREAPILEALIRDTLRTALGIALCGAPFAKFDERARRTLSDLCAVARLRGLRAEQLLLLLKEAWRNIPERRCLTSEEADLALANVITLCIKQYYAAPDQ